MSGRDPLPDNIEEEDENTLDDISGDEVRLDIHHSSVSSVCRRQSQLHSQAVTLDLNWARGYGLTELRRYVNIQICLNFRI